MWILSTHRTDARLVKFVNTLIHVPMLCIQTDIVTSTWNGLCDTEERYMYYIHTHTQVNTYMIGVVDEKWKVSFEKFTCIRNVYSSIPYIRKKARDNVINMFDYNSSNSIFLRFVIGTTLYICFLVGIFITFNKEKTTMFTVLCRHAHSVR